MAEFNENLGTYHLSSNKSKYELARSNNFRFIVTDLEGLVDPFTTSNGARISNATETLDFSVESFSVPHFQQNKISVQRGNSKINFAGVPEFGSGDLKITDYIGGEGDGNSKSVLMAWQALSYDVDTDTVGRAVDYKKDCMLLEYTLDNQLVRYWELKGCWVSSISEDPFNNTSGNQKRTLTAKIEYDTAIPHGPDNGTENWALN